MTQNTGGWALLAAGIGTALALLGAEMSQLNEWHAAITPAFVGKAIGHIAAALLAFAGGKLLPTYGAKD